jgi:hypothetical protein
MISWLKKVGKVKPVSATEVEFSRLGIGFEKLDRAVFDPEKAYDRVAALGVKWVRIQSGWQRTETEKGVYRFEWLDDIVDNLLRRGLVPWVNLCYGNKLYDEEAATRFGAVGCPPNQNEEQINAWRAYVKALVAHFKGKVTWWEVWNEPETKYSWRRAPDPFEYVEFTRLTAEAVRAGSPEVKVIGGVFARSDLAYISHCFAGGLGKYCDAISFHIYSADEADDDERIANLKLLIGQYCPGVELIQGEGGCQSRGDGCGALRNQEWTREKQAKSLARHLISQLGEGVKFTSYFSSMDMIEALNGKVGQKASYLDYGYFGVLGAEFDADGFAVGEYSPKPSYYALQTVAALFQGNFEVCRLPIESGRVERNPRFGGDYSDTQLRECYSCAFRRDNGSVAFVYWKRGNILRESFEGSISLHLPEQSAGTPRLIDIVTGAVYALNEADIVPRTHIFTKNMMTTITSAESARPGDTVYFRHLPLLDRPLALVFGDFCGIEAE